jgi:hypothetical protein
MTNHPVNFDVTTGTLGTVRAAVMIRPPAASE